MVQETVLPTLLLTDKHIKTCNTEAFTRQGLVNRFQSLLNVYYRSSRTQVFCKKGVLKNFAKPIGKHLCHDLFFVPQSLFVPEYFFSIEHLWWLLMLLVNQCWLYHKTLVREGNFLKIIFLEKKTILHYWDLRLIMKSF